MDQEAELEFTRISLYSSPAPMQHITQYRLRPGNDLIRHQQVDQEFAAVLGGFDLIVPEAPGLASLMCCRKFYPL
jgi:hypothetical protein